MREELKERIIRYIEEERFREIEEVLTGTQSYHAILPAI